MKRTRPGLEKYSVPLAAGAAMMLMFEAGRRLFRLTRLFCPSREPALSWNPADYGLSAERTEEVWFESADGQMLHGWYGRARDPIASGLYCHGNSGNLTTTAHVMPALIESGINILLFDYRGFGRSSGWPSVHGVISDTVAAARFHDQIRPQNLPSILYGYSLGGAVAAQALRHHRFDGLILQSTFTNLPDITRVTFPRLPLHLLTGRLFDTTAILRDLRIALLVIHGVADEVCPSWMARALHDASASSEKGIHMVEGGLHKNLWEREPGPLVESIRRFAAALQPSAQVLGDARPLHEQLLDTAFRFARRQCRLRMPSKAV